MSSMESLGLTIVLDAAALIAGTDNLFSLGGLVNAETGNSVYHPSAEANVRFFSVPEVFREIRDPRARARLALLQDSIVLRAPSSVAMAETIDFAKRTGDFSVLSLTDLKVIALTRMLEREANGDKFLKTAPAQRQISNVRIGRTIPFDVLDQIEAEQEQEGIVRNDAARGDGSKNFPGAEWRTVSKRNSRSTTVDLEDNHENLQENRESSLRHKTPSLEDKHVEKTKKEQASAKDGVETKEEVKDVKTKKTTKKEKETKEIAEPKLGEQEYSASEDKGNDQQVSSKSHRRRARPRRRRRKAVGVEPTLAADGNVRLVEDRADEAQATTENESRNIEGTFNPAQAVDAEEDCVQNCSSDETEDSDDDGSEWINEFNLEEHLARDRGEDVDSETERNRVACVTTDFAMQNTMLQMGLKLLSVDGRRSIRKIKHFALRCHSCGVVTTELERKFCDKCGNSCMHRVAYKIDKNGVARAFLNPKKKASLRGTKYPIPMPRGGRHNNDLILREDQIDPVKQRRLQKQRERLNVDVLDPSNFYNAGAKFNPNNKPLIVGYGRRNPNEVRGSSRGRR